MAEIKDMTREELRNHLKASRQFHYFDEDNEFWKRAIKLYEATGNKFDADCTGCRRRLVEWLEQE